jgi:hypothetical protein
VHPVPPGLHHVAELPGRDATAHCDDLVTEPPAVRDHELRATVLGRRDHRIRLGHGDRHRLLDEDRSAGPEQRDRLRRVEGVRRGDNGRVHVRIAHERLPVRRDPRDVVALGERPPALVPPVGDRDELPLRMSENPARVEVLDPSAAEQRDPSHAGVTL